MIVIKDGHTVVEDSIEVSPARALGIGTEILRHAIPHLDGVEISNEASREPVGVIFVHGVEQDEWRADAPDDVRKILKEKGRYFSFAESVDTAKALRILLRSHDCLAPDGSPEIPEHISAQFDIGLDDAGFISKLVLP